MISEIEVSIFYALMFIVFIMFESYIIMKNKLSFRRNIIFIIFFILLTFLLKYRLFPMQFSRYKININIIPFIGFTESPRKNLYLLQYLTMFLYGISFNILISALTNKNKFVYNILCGIFIILPIEIINVLLIKIFNKKTLLYDSSVILIYITGICVGYLIYNLAAKQFIGNFLANKKIVTNNKDENEDDYKKGI